MDEAVCVLLYITHKAFNLSSRIIVFLISFFFNMTFFFQIYLRTATLAVVKTILFREPKLNLFCNLHVDPDQISCVFSFIEFRTLSSSLNSSVWPLSLLARAVILSRPLKHRPLGNLFNSLILFNIHPVNRLGQRFHVRL